MAAKPKRARGSLKEYRKKRDFRVTSEPAGDRAAQPSRRRGVGGEFVVQKHDATRLHYDLRLEIDGVMRSWAVPKGPSLDPAEKRLAMETEDHPLAYNKFEGVIPKGEYGAGPVIIWDRGRWTPELDPLAAYAKGHIAFQLDGEKMRGGWDLVRMHGREDGRAWLLVKHRDAEARKGPAADLPARRPESVVSGRRVEDLGPPRADPSARRVGEERGRKTGTRPAARAGTAKRAGKRAPWSPPPTAPPGALPSRPAAQLCTLVDAAPDGGEWLHEVKVDGYRILARKSGDRVQLLSRNGKDWTDRFRGVADAVKTLPVGDLLLDGEVAAVGPDGKTSFQGLQAAIGGEGEHALVYVVFDLLHADGRDVSRLALIERKGALSTLIPAGHSVLRYGDHALGQGPAYQREACRLGLEGIVSKRADRPYVPARTRDWLKVRCGKRQEQSSSSATRSTASIRARSAPSSSPSTTTTARSSTPASVGTGFDTALRRDLKRRLDALGTADPPVADAPRAGPDVHWAKPRLVGEVAFTEWTADGRLRHPSFQGLREDKPATDVRRERPRHVDGDEVAPPAPPARARQTVVSARSRPAPDRVTVRRARGRSPAAPVPAGADVVAGVRITHPDRVLWAEQGIKKIDLARYYDEVAEWILPHVAGRPIALVRCPSGPGGECFFQKHPLPGAPPAGLETLRVDPGAHGLVSPVITGIEGLVWLVQMGTLEFHAWGARGDDLEHPDRLVMDLDPAPDVPFARVVAAAKDLRERLKLLGLTSFPKTTGGKGLHVVVPLAGRHGWDDVKSFARALADGMVADAPDLYLSQASKAKRTGKIYVDWLRNGRGATAVAAYSARAKPRATVSAPLAWDELGSRLKPDQWRIDNLPRRMRTLGKVSVDGVREGPSGPGTRDEGDGEGLTASGAGSSRLDRCPGYRLGRCRLFASTALALRSSRSTSPGSASRSGIAPATPCASTSSGSREWPAAAAGSSVAPAGWWFVPRTGGDAPRALQRGQRIAVGDGALELDVGAPGARVDVDSLPAEDPRDLPFTTPQARPGSAAARLTLLADVLARVDEGPSGDELSRARSTRRSASWTRSAASPRGSSRTAARCAWWPRATCPATTRAVRSRAACSTRCSARAATWSPATRRSTFPPSASTWP